MEPPSVTITDASSKETALMEAVRISQVLDGFTFRDQSNRTFTLLALRRPEIPLPANRAIYEQNMKTILTDLLNTPGETVLVIHGNARGRDGTIPALVFVGKEFNVNLFYMWRQLAFIDTEVPDWFDMKQFRADVANVPQEILEEIRRERR